MKQFHILIIALLLGIFSACNNPRELDWQGLEVTDLEGNPVSMEQYAGKKVFLNFWATWCGPCLAEMPSMEEARQELESDGYVFVLVSDEQPELLEAFRKKRDFNFEFLRLNQSIKTTGIFSIPQTYLIGTDGNIAHAVNGGTNWGSDRALALLRSVN